MPFFFSNFLAFFAPLPNNPDYEKATQWELSASFGDGGSTVIDMMHVADLGVLVGKCSFRPNKKIEMSSDLLYSYMYAVQIV